MTEHKDGGPAFPARPMEHFLGATSITVHHGMSLRDYFAGQVIASDMNGNPNLPGDMAGRASWPAPAELAQRRAVWAYLQADAMLAAREVRK
jgi:hypothetical protein